MKFIITLLLSIFVTSAFAQSASLGYSTGDGFIRISVGDSTSSDVRQLTRRIYRLENAVRDLQDRIYDLEDGQFSQISWTCSIVTKWGDAYFSRPMATRGEAMSSAYSKCARKEAFNSNCTEDGRAKVSCTN